MKINKFLRYCFLLILPAAMLASCEKAPQEEFMKGGEIIYTGKPDSLQSFAGYKRNKLTWYLVSDPKISKAKVFWNNPVLPEGRTQGPNDRNPGRDSVIIDIQRTSGKQLVEVNIDRLEEGVYTFDVYTYDKNGNTSIKSEVIGEVYAETFQNSISNRSLDSAEYYTTLNEVKLKWFGVAQQAVVVDLNYTDVSGQLKSIQITKVIFDPRKPGAFVDRDILPDYKEGTAFQYRTGYLPVPTAIDTFFTGFREVVPTLYMPPPPPPSGPANLALNTTVTTSSSSGTPLTDGDRSNTTKWQPSSGERADLNVWFYADLGSAQDMTSTQVYFTKDPGKITYYEVLYTADATIGSSTKWNRAFIKFGPPDAEDINAFNRVQARYVKVNIGLKDSGTNINVSELEVYNN
jgi:hypothetical protein